MNANATSVPRLSIEEKKSLRKANEEIEAAAEKLRGAGVQVEVSVEPAVVHAYDFEALGQAKTDVLARLGFVPVRILDAITTLVEDPDYKEALQEIRAIVFVPSDTPNGPDFDYDTSVERIEATLTVTYVPMQWMHGGYERSIKAQF